MTTTDARVHPGVLLAVFSPKGGVGTSFLATRIALALAADRTRRVTLVDLDVTGGDCAVLLGLGAGPPGSVLSLLGLCRGPGDVFGAALETVALAHPSGLRLLAAAPLDEAARGFGAAETRRLLGALRAHGDVLVADVRAGVDERSVGALTAADHVLLVTTPEAPCVRGARRLVEALARHRFPLGRVSIVHNMAGPADLAGGARVAAALHLPLSGSVPFAPKVVRGLVNGAEDGPVELGDDEVTSTLRAMAAALPVARRMGSQPVPP